MHIKIRVICACTEKNNLFIGANRKKRSDEEVKSFFKEALHVAGQHCPCFKKRSKEYHSFDMKTGTLTQFTGVISSLRDVYPTRWSWGAYRGGGMGIIEVSPGHWVLRGQEEVHIPGGRRLGKRGEKREERKKIQ